MAGGLAASSSTAAETRIALVIGNARYLGLQPLRNSVADARLVSTTLGSLGFKVIAIEDADQSGMRKAIRSFADALALDPTNTIALFYYAGHGVQLDGTNYLIPVDARIATARDVVLDGFPLQDILSSLEDAHRGTNIVILDACRDNPFQAGTRGFSRGLAQVDAPNGSLIAYSTAPGQVAEDGSGANSPYTEALAKHLRQPGLAIEQVFKNVRVDVNAATGGRQVPWEEQSLVQDIMLAGGQPATPAVGATATPAPPPAAKTDAEQTRRDYFKAMEVNTIEAYEAFILKYPESSEAKQAQTIIKMLAEEKSWRDAEQRNTAGAYKMFLELHPSGTYAESAKAALALLEKGAPKSDAVIRTVEQQPPAARDPLVLAPGYDAYGYDMKTVKGISFDGCQQACEANPACQAVSYAQVKSWCFLKERATLLIRNASAQSAYRSSASAGLRYSNMEIVTKTDIPGSDFARLKGVDFLSCLSACEGAPQCRAFSYVRKKQDCWLKAANGPLVPNTKVDSGIR